ncbi:HNH endonuclease [Stenotrophomonas acidaminiphila]|uniref:HNH endonuclease n=1 Tax=Stenotrophomonas acidaminiphila TaxID=128780 RepID=UPI003D00F580
MCILCLESHKPLTEEHIFPEAAGGSIAKHLLCKACNDKLGHWIDAPYLDQKHIQLARATYKIQGKTGKVPQPFSDTYTIDESESKLRIKLDSNFAPRVVPQTPRVWITKNREIGLILSRDVRDKKEIPKVIRTTLSRFLNSEAGQQLGWSEEEKEQAIQRSIEGSKQVSPRPEKIQPYLSGRWTIDLKALFAEYVKVIYEICCIEFSSQFRDSASGQRLRTFLLAQCATAPAPWDWIEAAKHLNVAPQVPPDLDDFIKRLTKNNQHTYHIAVVTPSGVVCSMLGMGAVFHTKDLEQIATASDVAKVYMSSINGGKSGIFALGELLSHTDDF